MNPSTLATKHRSEDQTGLEKTGAASLTVHKTRPEVASSAEQVPSKEAANKRSFPSQAGDANKLPDEIVLFQSNSPLAVEME